MNTIALLTAAIAYGFFYAAAPGRQALPFASPRVLQFIGSFLTVAALTLGVLAYGSGIGPLLVLTVMMTVASVLAISGPFFQSPS